MKELISKSQIFELENAILASPEQVDLESLTEHYFAPGIYLRSLFIPAGTVLTGKIHRYETMNILVFGTIRVVNTSDGEMREVTGPRVFNSPAGTKKAGYAVTDCLFMNVHPTESQDLKEIEAEMIAPSFEDLLEEQKCRGLSQEQ
jgi:hypothetical protein